MANKAKDLASGTLSSSTSASSTSISVSCGSGSDLALLTVWPTPPFYITVMPANPSASVPNSLDSEVMRVSALNANDGIVNMAVSRGQRGTTAKAFSAGDIVSHAVYAEDAVLLGEEVSPENPSPWVGTDEIEDGAITDVKLANKKVNVQSIVLDGMTTTLLEQVTALAAADIDYARFSCTYDGASSGISDKPTGNTNASFVCEAYRTRAYTATSWRYQLVAYVKETLETYKAEAYFAWDGGEPEMTAWSRIYVATELYSGDQVGGTITLSDGIANYKYIEIYAKEIGSRQIYTKVQSPASGDRVIISGVFPTTGGIYVRTSIWTWGTNTLAWTESRDQQITSTSTPGSTSANTRIYKIVGYK